MQQDQKLRQWRRDATSPVPCDFVVTITGDEGAAEAEGEGKKKKTRRGGGPKPIKKKEPGVGGK
eukprot:29955-Eustigmatos_ZCMA.PRE.1